MAKVTITIEDGPDDSVGVKSELRTRCGDGGNSEDARPRTGDAGDEAAEGRTGTRTSRGTKVSSELTTDELASGAIISPCGHYRYHLWRIWEPTLPVCVWVMLNPSTADEHTDDPTIRKCIAIAKHNGFGGISVRNVFAYRATDKTELLKVSDPVGPDNTEHLLAARSVSILTRLVLGWGKPFGGDKLAPHFRNAEVILRTLSPYCIKQNKDGSPIHPLYQKNESKMVLFV